LEESNRVFKLTSERHNGQAFAHARYEGPEDISKGYVGKITVEETRKESEVEEEKTLFGTGETTEPIPSRRLGIFVDQSGAANEGGLQRREYITSKLAPFPPQTGERAKRLRRRRNNPASEREEKRRDDSSVRATVGTLYKRKDQKVHPVNYGGESGEKPGGLDDWQRACFKRYHRQRVAEETTEFDDYLRPRITSFPQGQRLTQERLELMVVGDDVWPNEKKMLTAMLLKREGAFTWSFENVSRIREEIVPPQRIRTVPHEAWQHPGFKVPRALYSTACEMFKERVKNGIYEPCQGPYRNPWFLVGKKQKNKYRVVVAAMLQNKVTIRDANMPPDPDEFVEEFSGCAVASLIDWFSGYDQITLAEEDRDITAVQTPLGLLRQTTIQQGGANSVAQFVRIVSKILHDVIPEKAQVFLDDIGVKGPKTKYDNELSLPGIRRFMYEHIRNLDHVLWLVELAGGVVSAEKSQFLMSGIKMVGWVCDYDGRHADSAKVAKLLNWPVPTNIVELRGFNGTAVYFRVNIEKFQWVMEPLYRPMRKGNSFFWHTEQQEAFERIKEILSTFPVVLPLDYTQVPLLIIVAVDASEKGFGAVLMQIQRGKRHPARYESGVWSDAERKYDAGKRECRGVLKALKKFRHWLYGIHFTLEVDAQTLVAQLNRSATDLPGALVTSWIAWIRLFDFTVRHVPGTKHTAADGLSRRPATQEEELAQRNEQDIDDFVQGQIGCIMARVNPVSSNAPETEIPRILDDSYSDESERIATYLSTLQRPPELSRSEYASFRKKAVKFLVEGQHLFRRASKNSPLRRVVDDHDLRHEILQQLHDETGHKGREGTYHRIAARYWWPGLYEEVANYVKTCFACQSRDPNRQEEALHPTWTSTWWERVHVDTIHMPSENGYRYFLIARCHTSLWCEGIPIRKANPRTVVRFIREHLINRYGCPAEIVMDGGPEMLGEVTQELSRHGVKRVRISAYHPMANGGVERLVRIFKESLSKQNNGQPIGWTKLWPCILMADRTTVKQPLGMSPYRFVFGQDAVLPIELEVPTWATLPWETVRTTEELLAMRARQIDRRDQDIQESVYRLHRMRFNNKEYFDDHHTLRQDPLKTGDPVLEHNTVGDEDMSRQNTLRFRWLGPYCIRRDYGNGAFQLEELDGTPISKSVAGNRLKRFHFRRGEEELTHHPDTPVADAANQDADDTSSQSSEGVDERQNLAGWLPEGWDVGVVID
jgi:hypothetical protein